MYIQMYICTQHLAQAPSVAPTEAPTVVQKQPPFLHGPPIQEGFKLPPSPSSVSLANATLN